MVRAVRAPGLQVLGGQRTLMGPHNPQHVLVPQAEVLETVPHRHPRRARGHERHRQLPYTSQ